MSSAFSRVRSSESVSESLSAINLQKMENTLPKVHEFVTKESLGAAVVKILMQLRIDSEQDESWKCLHSLLAIDSLDVEKVIDVKEVLELCISYLIKPDSTCPHTRIVTNIIILLIEKCSATFKDDAVFKSFLQDVEASIICQSNANQLHDNCKLNYETATTTMSLLLPTIMKANLSQDSSHKTIQVIRAMVDSKNEKSIVEALAFMLPCIINQDQTHFQSVCESIQQLFQVEQDKLGNCPGLVALCSIADILFSNSYQHRVFEDQWFLQNTKRGLGSLVGLNRKRCQYLLKRYVDSTNQPQVELFYDFFLILETFEERQLHIIKPVLAKLEALEQRILVNKDLDPSWLCSIYIRMLTHDNLQLIKIGLHKVCHLKLELWPGFGTDEDWLYDAFLAGLNTVTFYVREDKTNQQLPVLGQDLVQMIQKCSALATERTGFFARLLKGMSLVTWNSIGLFHLCYALASIPNGEEFVDEKMLRIVLEFLRSALYNQHPLLRSAVQSFLLEFVLNGTVVSQENLLWVAHIIATLDRSECYVRNSVLHTKLKTWIHKRFTPSQLGEMLDKLICLHCQFVQPTADSSGYSVDVTTVARFSVLLLDAESMDSEAMQLLESSLETLAHCHTRMYADERILNQRMRLMATLLNESGDSVAVQRLVTPLLESVVHYCLNQIDSSTDYPTICESLSVLSSIVSTGKLVGVGRLETIIRHFLQDESSSAVTKFKAVSLLRFLPDADELIHHMIQLKMHCRPPKRDDEALRDVTWGAFMSHYFTNVWSLLEDRLPHLKVNEEEMVEEAACAIDLAGVEAVKCIQQCLVHLLPLVCDSNPDLCRSTLRQCWVTAMLNFSFIYLKKTFFSSLLVYLLRQPPF